MQQKSFLQPFLLVVDEIAKNTSLRVAAVIIFSFFILALFSKKDKP
jgi:hypothetical protein